MRLWTLLLLLFLSSCIAYRRVPTIPSDELSEMTWVVEMVMTRWRHRSGNRLRLENARVIHGATMNMLELEISSQEILEVRQARDLLVDLVESLLRDINLDPHLADRLPPGSFTANNLVIHINFESYFGAYVDPFYVGCIKLHGGMAYYYAFDLKEYKDWYDWHSRVESYEKTREISYAERAAEKAFEVETGCGPHPILPGIMLPDEPNLRCRYKRKF